jgi:pyruvate/2-oxoglutarate/acetoin dehydrogenase E1 component
VVATICEEAFYSLEAPVARVGGYDVPYPVGMLEEHYVPDAARVVAAALRVCGEGS